MRCRSAGLCPASAQRKGHRDLYEEQPTVGSALHERFARARDAGFVGGADPMVGSRAQRGGSP
ncbi:hypothetical protein RZA67_08915 [Stenotrophomonas sp. C3(2023)]|uniref:hypothetical protein n=1 Tax=Stenotrophomonas sp. C3(2023) TaxID=3080277 RepID=UPI00293D0873|nr:hypothetical protein [Stenotrophomonas sp. C3(2023)]MDV3468847.1 hypothetical protein [Stenotrophomonas sp. C3(2023)]